MLATLAGLALLSTLTLLVGLAGQCANRWAVLLPVFVLLLAAWLANSKISARADRNFKFAAVDWLPEGIKLSGVFGQLASRLVVVLTILLAIAYMLGAMMPPYEFDVVEYHLQSAKEFFQLGAIRFNDHNVYINMPLGLEMHALAAMSIAGGADGWWFGGLVGKSILGAHSLIAAALVGGFAMRRSSSQWVGWGTAGLWLAVPGNAHVSMTGLIDAAMGSYMAACAIALTELADRLQSDRSVVGEATDDRRSSTPWLVLLIFLFAGAAAAAKYTGLIYAVIPCFITTIAIGVRNFRGNARTAMLKYWSASIAGGLLLTCVPWYLKNAVLTGNPFYPLAYEWFGGVGLNAERAAQWSQAHRVPIDAVSGSAYSLGALMTSAKQLLVASEFVQPSLIILLICGLIGVWHLKDKRRVAEVWFWAAGALWILSVWWVATHRIDRFWLPAVSLAAPIAGIGLLWLSRYVSHGLATAILLTGLGFGLLINTSPVIGDTRFFVSLAALRTDDGNADELAAEGGGEELPGRMNRSTGWCNEHLDLESTKLALVGEARAFDFRMPVIYNTCFDPSPAEAMLRVDGAEDNSMEKLREKVRSAGVTHVLVNWAEISRYRSPGNYGFSDWPTRPGRIATLVESGLLKPVGWPISGEIAELFEVDLK